MTGEKAGGCCTDLTTDTTEVKEQLVRTATRAHVIEVALVAVAAVAVIIAVATAVWVGLGNREYQRRIRDCTDPQGRCYQQNQRNTAAAVQTILDYIQNVMDPHRLRSEAETLCNVVADVEVTLNIQGDTTVDVDKVLDHYRHCVLENSGLTPAPPAPENPLSTTTTTTR